MSKPIDGKYQADPDADLSGTRHLEPKTKIAVASIAIFMSLFHIVVLTAKPLEPLVFRSTTLFLASVLTFAMYPGWQGASRTRIHLVDYLLMAASAAAYSYTLVEHKELIFRMGVVPTPLDALFGFVIVLIVLEMARRTMGIVLPLFSAILIFYMYLGPWLPGLFMHPGYSFARSMSFLYGMEGIFGIPLGVASTYVMIFLIFGAFLKVSQTRDFIMDLAFAITGKTRGGPAKVAVVASSFFGTISGSTIANVVGTGVVTIPMMKQVGYKPQFAGAVEAVASTGGTIMPPIMGAAAFLMVEIIGVPYTTIALAAAIPAILYYLAVFWMIDLRAQRIGLMGLQDKDIPNARNVLARRGQLLAPIVVLVVAMFIVKMSPLRAGLVATLATIIVSWFSKDTRIDIKRALEALESTSMSAASVVAAVAVSGITIGVFALTGLGLKFTSIVLDYSGGNLLLTLVFTMVVALVLGMGMPTTGAYVICAVLAAPALIKIGIAPLIAHFFVLYFANISNITPPVALASLTAAGIAKADPIKTAVEAFKLGSAGFIVPFMFAYGPALLGIGSLWLVLSSVFTAIIGTLALGCAIQGWYRGLLNLVQRGLFLAGALFLIKPGFSTDVIGLVCLALVIVPILITTKRRQQSARV